MNTNTTRLNRRQILKAAGGLGIMAFGASMSPMAFAAWNKAAFEGKSLDDVLKALGGSSADKSGAITINAPDIAENGAVVPVGVTTTMAKTQQIAILVEKNPSALAAQFIMAADTEPFVASRVKMGQTSNVHALVKADGKWFVTTKEVKVTLGGCGG